MKLSKPIGGANPPTFIVKALRPFANMEEGNIPRGARIRVSRDRAYKLQQIGLVEIEVGGIETKRLDSPEAVGAGDSRNTGTRTILGVKRPRGRPRKVQDDRSQ